jgi:hypothetical protein
MSRYVKPCVAVACCLALLAALPAEAQTKKQTKAAQKFRSDGEASRKAIESVRDQMKKTLEAYDAVLNAKEKKLASAHKKLTGELNKTEKSVESGRKTVTAFTEGAQSFFQMWEANLDSISTESIRQASEIRLQAARSSFEAMKGNLAQAKEAYEPMMASLREQATLLGQDMSADTVAMMRDDVAPDVKAKGEKVLASLEHILSNEAAEEAKVDEILDEEEAEPESALDEGDADEEGA